MPVQITLCPDRALMGASDIRVQRPRSLPIGALDASGDAAADGSGETTASVDEDSHAGTSRVEAGVGDVPGVEAPGLGDWAHADPGSSRQAATRATMPERRRVGRVIDRLP
ncbi:MAG: hypothetical protein KF809_07305 [Chloroflexi bacterium]|nr:hypothetical protein [Chloroflexota bacterium]